MPTCILIKTSIYINKNNNYSKMIKPNKTKSTVRWKPMGHWEVGRTKVEKEGTSSRKGLQRSVLVKWQNTL